MSVIITIGLVILAIFCCACLYVVWSLHQTYVNSIHKLFDVYTKSTESMQTALQSKSLEDRLKYETEKARTEFELTQYQEAYQAETQARIETAKLAAEAVNEINGRISVEGVSEAASKKNMSMAEFYRKFEEIV